MASRTPVLRFAPSPNGRLHLGHAASALTCWRAAELAGGVCLLRIEDIDPVRCRPEFVSAIFEDLAWLGLDWPKPVMRQSKRMAAYRAASEMLVHEGVLYRCFCSRREVSARAMGSDPDGAPLYPGTCRNLPDAEVAARLARGEQPQWRLDMAAAIAEAGQRVVRFMPGFAETGQLGPDAIRPAVPERWGDAVLVRKDTPTSYHLSVVVDDAAQGISHVTRGEDLAAATDLHVLVQALLGLDSPVYGHHRLVTDGAGDKLAKSRGSQSLSDLRAKGWTPADVRRQLGF
jgi:glutamyl-Q tRNA(Asp) synthetase